MLASLEAASQRWLELSPGEIAEALGAVKERVLAVAEDWVRAASAAKGLPENSALQGEEWCGGPWGVLAALNAYSQTLSALAAGRDPLASFGARARDDGQTVVDVFPANKWDALLLSGYRCEVWQEPGVTRETLPYASRFRRPGSKAGGVSVVLGAGNVAAIPALDALYKLVSEGEVCLVKLNPVNDYLAPIFTEAFAPLSDFVKFCRGDASVGAYLCAHPKVATLHVTGSSRTHDTIVFGSGEAGARRKAANEPANTRPTTCELGGVGGTIVVPGDWSARDFSFQAEHLVTQKLHNAGCNCIASQVLVLSRRWTGTRRLVAEVKKVLRTVLDRRPDFYPGTQDRIRVFLEAHPDAERLGTSPFLFVDSLDADVDDVCYRIEAFGPVWAVALIDEADPAAFLAKATAFANDKLHGTLGCQLVVDPVAETENSAALAAAVADLRYGVVGINAWSGCAFLLPFATWGAFPGGERNDVRSGVGVVHNALLFDKPQKSVLRGPFREFPRTILSGIFHISPKPLWFVTHARADRVARSLTEFEATRNLALLPGLFARALLG